MTPPPRNRTIKFRLRGITWVLVSCIVGLILVYGIPVLMTADEWFLQFVKSLLFVTALVLGLSEIRRLNSRLAHLSRVANDLGRGKYDARADIRGHDSVALVGQALNKMAERIASSIHELEKSHRELAKSQEKLAAQNQELTRAYDRQARFGEFLAKMNTIDIAHLAHDSFSDLVTAARAHVGVLLLFNESSQRLELITEAGIDRAGLRKLIPENAFEGLPGEAFTRREWIILDDIDQDLFPELNLGFASARIQTVYAIPLLFDNKALGVAVLASLNKPAKATIQVLRNYVRALAHALNNALTYQAVQQQTVKFEAANARLLHLDHHRRQFVANMSHELRTPLNSIIGFSNILLKNRDNSMTPDNLDRVEKINRNGKHLLQLINDILDLSKVEAGRMETDFAPVPIKAIIREVADMLYPQANAKGISLTVELPAEDVITETDAQKLRQVLINLTNNAVKFTDSGTVTLALLPPTASHGAAILVRDTGIGITGEKLEFVFEAFRQADSTTSRKYGGTGLGLTISKSLVTLLGGRIRVESKVGRGSTFTVELPQRTATRKSSGNGRDLQLDIPTPAGA